MNGRTIRVGIAGFDHFFAGLAAVEAIKHDPDTTLVIAAHHDLERLREAVAPLDVQLTTDYREVVDADIDLLVTACPTAQNAALVIAAAEQGKHIVSVKPFAMNMDEADQIVSAVKRAGVRFISCDTLYRFRAEYQQCRAWIAGEEIGRPISTFCMVRASLPAIIWFGDPFVEGRSWWLDPAQSPAGGWIDHSIYYVDMLRWVFGSEVERVSGEIANLKHPDEAFEDFGVANMVFANGAVATVEVTWTIEQPGLTTAFHLVGTNGQFLTDMAGGKRMSRRVNFRRPEEGWQDDVGWQNAASLPDRGEVTAHLLAVLRGEAEPVADEDDSRATLASCLAFYDAARSHTVVTL